MLGHPLLLGDLQLLINQHLALQPLNPLYSPLNVLLHPHLVPTGQLDLPIPTLTFENKTFLNFPSPPLAISLFLPRRRLFSSAQHLPPASEALMSAVKRKEDDAPVEGNAFQRMPQK